MVKFLYFLKGILFLAAFAVFDINSIGESFLWIALYLSAFFGFLYVSTRSLIFTGICEAAGLSIFFFYGLGLKKVSLILFLILFFINLHIGCTVGGIGEEYKIDGNSYDEGFTDGMLHHDSYCIGKERRKE